MNAFQSCIIFVCGVVLIAVSLICVEKPKPAPMPPLYFKDGAWYTDGSKEMVARALTGAYRGEIVYIAPGQTVWKDDKNNLIFKP